MNIDKSLKYANLQLKIKYLFYHLAPKLCFILNIVRSCFYLNAISNSVIYENLCTIFNVIQMNLFWQQFPYSSVTKLTILYEQQKIDSSERKSSSINRYVSSPPFTNDTMLICSYIIFFKLQNTRYFFLKFLLKILLSFKYFVWGVYIFLFLYN